MTETSSPRPPDGTPHHRLCLAADVEQYSRLDARAQSAVQADLVRILDEAAALTGLDRAAWERQPQGDLEFAVLPENTPEATVLGPFVNHLADGLSTRNAMPSATRIRLRVAVDKGLAKRAPLGHAGHAPVAVARFVNAPQLKAVLAALAAADLAVIVSDRLYQDIVRSGGDGLAPEQYVRANVKVKDFGGYGWIRVPGHGADDMRPVVDGPQQPLPSPSAHVPGPAVLSQVVRHGAAVGRDVTGGLTIGAPVDPSDSRRRHR
ncbi:hypothetical protein [Kitasatospora sp. CB02891]|uniref:hypothetical protein n=1 Tax=Kitasatospora sp. CB02891 TaxID=2020329 RepID=UPI000C27169B|nr:hypothetical protein [Kitasatospora sp. CB02891]PJN28203.1 hypothetical protein CG736_08565 [Kitasatospora sp. CB02891]